MDFILIIDFDKARKRHRFYQAKRTLIWNMFLSYCDGDHNKNRLEVDLIVGMYSIAKKSLVFYYAPSMPATWFQSFPVNIGADGRYGCPQVYNIHYVESLNTKMDGGYVNDIVDNARKSNWIWNPRIGMHTLARPETICLDQDKTIMGQGFRCGSAVWNLIPHEAKVVPAPADTEHVACTACPAPKGYQVANDVQPSTCHNFH